MFVSRPAPFDAGLTIAYGFSQHQRRSGTACAMPVYKCRIVHIFHSMRHNASSIPACALGVKSPIYPQHPFSYPHTSPHLWISLESSVRRGFLPSERLEGKSNLCPKSFHDRAELSTTLPNR